MSRRVLTVDRYKEIERLLAAGRGVREITRALKCSRRLVRQIRDGLHGPPDQPRSMADPPWMVQVNWPEIVHDLGFGHPLKFLWEEKAQALTTYSNFWKQFYRKFPQYRQAAVTARDFEPGERVEVDYAGDTLEWVELSTGEIHKAFVFVAGLGFSQLLFAWAAADTRSANWLGCHRRMFAFYGGVAHVTVPDCLKTGVLKCHLYDPDLNPGYAELASHYATAVVPARAGHAKDKAVVEGLVKILMRYVRFRHRRQRFSSLAQINQAIGECTERINARPHSRFGVSRRARFERIEKAALKPLPAIEFDIGEWKNAKLHPDCYIQVESVYYSAPHIHRGKMLRVKLTEHHVEIFLELERLAVHPRSRHKDGRRIKIDAHFPPASQAYYEATPQKLLSQARFIHPQLHQLVLDLFNADVYGHIRRVQGLIRAAAKELQIQASEPPSQRIEAAILQMRHFEKVRVPYFKGLLAQSRHQKPGAADPSRQIVRVPGNPMLRYVRGSLTADPVHPNQENLKL